MVWHLCNGYSVHSFPGFCWFTDYSNSILIKLYLIWVYLVVCLVWSVERSCFGKWVDTCAEKAFADVLTWCNDKRWFQQRVQEWVRDLQPDSESAMKETGWTLPAMLAQETPRLGYLPFITNFLPSHSTGFPLLSLRKLVIMSFPIHMCALQSDKSCGGTTALLSILEHCYWATEW